MSFAGASGWNAKCLRMGLSFHCPQCSQAVPALPTQMGQSVTCPACRAQFRLSPILLGGNGQSTPAARPAPVAKTATTPPPPPVAGSVKHSGQSASPAAAPPILAPAIPRPAPAPAPPTARPNVARFIAAGSLDSTVQLTADGKLPELSLAEATVVKKSKSSESNTSPLVLGLVLVGSTLASILLLVAPFDGGPPSSTSVKEARQGIEQFYAGQDAPLLPYQVLLRDSQRANLRADYKAERELYRQVLALLHSESRDRYSGLTGTKSGDEELERLLAILLSTEGGER